MCTCIAKVTSTKFTVLTGLPCCLSVEEVEEHYPSISRARGWREVPIEVYPSSESRSRDGSAAEEEIDHRTERRFVGLTLDDEGRAILRKLTGATRRTFVASLTFRARTIRFRSRDQISVLKDYIASRLREPHRYTGYEAFLRNIPAVFLRRSRARVLVKRLNRLLETV